MVLSEESGHGTPVEGAAGGLLEGRIVTSSC